jgi:uncharacterized protein (DUF433 family)
MATIVQDEAIRSGVPRIQGTRITVLDVKRRVIDNEDDPHVVAGEYDLSLADLFRALTYFYDHRDDLEALEREAAAARHEGEGDAREFAEAVEDGELETSERAD